MKNFYFEQSFREYLVSDKKSVRNANIILVALLLMYLASAFLGLGNGDFLLVIVLFGGVFMLLNCDGFQRQRKSHDNEEKWVVSLSGTHLSWASPPSMLHSSNEISFEIDTDEIVEVQKSYSDFDENSPYMFCLKNGVKITPSINSSIDMDELIDALKERGILSKRVSSFDR
ncbi:MAG: hypothetical protein ACRBEE_13035 [Arenicella sp.]